MQTHSTVETAKEMLNDWLSKGVVQPGGKLPSERELEELLGIKRMTLRQALLFLEGEEKIFRKDRRGWFVALPCFKYTPNTSTSFKQAALEQGRLPSWGFLEKERVYTAEPEILSQLNVKDGDEIYKISGWGALDNHKVFYHETFINAQSAPGFIDKLGDRSFVDVWQEAFGKSSHTQHLAFKPTRLSAGACKGMGGTAGTPSIRVEKYRADEAGQVIQVDIEYWRFESVEFYIDFQEFP